jgi:hypothetical protein
VCGTAQKSFYTQTHTTYTAAVQWSFLFPILWTHYILHLGFGYFSFGFHFSEKSLSVSHGIVLRDMCRPGSLCSPASRAYTCVVNKFSLTIFCSTTIVRVHTNYDAGNSLKSLLAQKRTYSKCKLLELLGSSEI